MALWTPLDLGAKLRAWYDWQDTATITESGGLISAITDKSTNAINLSEGTGGNQMTLSATGFDGALQAAVGVDSDRIRSANGANVWPTSNLRTMQRLSQTTLRFTILGGASTRQLDGAFTDLYIPVLVAAMVNGEDVTLWENGYSRTVSGTLTGITDTASMFAVIDSDTLHNTSGDRVCDQTSGGQMTIANTGTGNRDLLGATGEHIYCTGVLTSGEREQVEGYLAHKWNLEGSLDAGHPYKAAPPTTGSTYTLVAASGSYTLTGTATNLLRNRYLAADSGSFTVTGTSVGLFKNRRLVATSGSYSLTGTDVDFLRSRRLVAASGSYSLTGTSVGILKNSRLTAASGSYSLVGSDVNFLRNRRLLADSGSYSLSGTSVDLLRNRRLAADSGSYSLTGTSVVLTYNPFNPTSYTIVCDSGSFTLTGTAVDLFHNRRLFANSGSYALSGDDLSILYNRVLNAESGSYVLTGTDLDLLRNRLLQAESGSYALTGTDLDFIRNYRIQAESGNYILLGSPVDLIYSADPPPEASGGYQILLRRRRKQYGS